MTGDALRARCRTCGAPVGRACRTRFRLPRRPHPVRAAVVARYGALAVADKMRSAQVSARHAHLGLAVSLTGLVTSDGQPAGRVVYVDGGWRVVPDGGCVVVRPSVGELEDRVVCEMSDGRMWLSGGHGTAWDAALALVEGRP